MGVRCRRLMVVGCLLALGAVAAVVCQGVSIEAYFAEANRVLAVDYRDGTLALGTSEGLFILRHGRAMRFGRSDGLPEEVVRNLVLVDGGCLFAGPFKTSQGWRFARVDLVGSGVAVADITEDEHFSFPDVAAYGHKMLGIGPDGSLWAGDVGGLHRYESGWWERFAWPAGFSCAREGRICFGPGGAVWVVGDREVSLPHNLARFEEGQWTVFDEIRYTSAVGVDRGGRVWRISWPGMWEHGALWRYDDDEWRLISSDPIWEDERIASSSLRPVYEEMHFDGNGTLYAVGRSSIVIWEQGKARVSYEACGIPFRNKVGPVAFFTSAQVVLPSTLVAGTYGSGLLIFDGLSWSRLYLGGIPGNEIALLAEDAQGSLWVNDRETYLFGVFDGQRWRDFYLPIDDQETGWSMDIDGSLWFTAQEGAVRVGRGAAQLYDASNSPLLTASQVAVDRSGTVWLVQDTYHSPGAPAQVISFHDENWEQYPSRDYFHGAFGLWYVRSVTVGPKDAKWFRRTGGYTVLEGGGWRHLHFGEGVPSAGRLGARRSLRFDLDGHVFFYGYGGLCWGEVGGDWEVLFYGPVRALEFDAHGNWWLGTDAGLLCWDGRRWQKMTEANGLSNRSITTILIDHNGDKWVGTKHGLNRIEDGSSLPPGDYTFIGGISLLGGIDLLIGPRDSKLCLARYRKE